MEQHPGPLFAWHVLEEEEAARRERSAVWVANTRIRVEARRRAAEESAILRSPGRAPSASFLAGLNTEDSAELRSASNTALTEAVASLQAVND